VTVDNLVKKKVKRQSKNEIKKNPVTHFSRCRERILRRAIKLFLRGKLQSASVFFCIQVN